jgi:hypothetical protein
VQTKGRGEKKTCRKTAASIVKKIRKERKKLAGYLEFVGFHYPACGISELENINTGDVFIQSHGHATSHNVDIGHSATQERVHFQYGAFFNRVLEFEIDECGSGVGKEYYLLVVGGQFTHLPLLRHRKSETGG